MLLLEQASLRRECSELRQYLSDSRKEVSKAAEERALLDVSVLIEVHVLVYHLDLCLFLCLIFECTVIIVHGDDTSRSLHGVCVLKLLLL